MYTYIIRTYIHKYVKYIQHTYMYTHILTVFLYQEITVSGLLQLTCLHACMYVTCMYVHTHTHCFSLSRDSRFVPNATTICTYIRQYIQHTYILTVFLYQEIPVSCLMRLPCLHIHPLFSQSFENTPW